MFLPLFYASSIVGIGLNKVVLRDSSLIAGRLW